MRIDPDLRAAWQSLRETEGDQPGYDYDLGYLTGWYDQRRHIRRREPRGLFRDAARVAEFRLGYRHGREDGEGRAFDWWPDFALGRLVDGVPVPGSGEPVRAEISRARYSERTGQPAEEPPSAVSVGLWASA